MNPQLNLSFVGLTTDHNRHGQDEVYQDNRPHFQSQTEVVLSHLRNGEVVTGARMFTLHQIQDIRPRIAAIRKLFLTTGERLLENRIKGANGAKEWWIECNEKGGVTDRIINNLK